MSIGQKLFSMFAAKTPEQKAATEIAQSQISRMDAQAAAEYANAIASYHDALIKRQKTFLSAPSRIDVTLQ